MKLATSVDIPNERKPDYRKAKWLQWITIVYLISVVFVLYLVMGSSQAMRAAWLEDLLSLVPSIAWTITTPIAWRKPDPKFPYGYHRSVSIGYLAASLPLLLLGLFLVGDAAMKLVQAEHPTMGTLVIFGQPVWIGWPALLALIYSSVPSVILGRMKLKLADRLHDKVLYADAKMRKADWMTAGAAMIGIIGVGFGIWWLDAAAALVIGLDVIRDGFTQTKHAIGDLTDRRPMTTTQEKEEDLPERVRNQLCRLDWVKDAQVRLREAGHILYGQGFVVPTVDRVAVETISKAADDITRMDWRLAEFVLTPVTSFDGSNANGETGDNGEK
ncbi:cation transporter [Roseibium salinum]|uniref:Cation transporter n=1 Tax=Roseibium salinum TaxID=1604349 RepID=A0ABT3QXF9_9HYPH|nr:cation transporter [Roseibium sp. DSM 29163]MCX2721629.1 cation transporter [Roseibium sp. DSM 29163]